jgi:hypothetical protein
VLSYKLALFATDMAGALGAAAIGTWIAPGRGQLPGWVRFSRPFSWLFA